MPESETQQEPCADLQAELETLYRTYIGTTVALQRGRKFGDGLLGFGHGPEHDHSHQVFMDDVAALMERFRAAGDAGMALAALRMMYEAPLDQEGNKLAYWMLLAVQNLTPPLIGLLSPADAAGLLQWYQKAYPRRKRMPAQKQVIRALADQAGQQR